MPSKHYHKRLTEFLASGADAILDWTTPRQNLRTLANNPGKNFIEWENYRDNMCRKWINLNVMCGLVMGAVSTIIFSDYPLSRAGFALGVVSLLSSLIATGFGVGLIYVLGDVKGARYQSLMEEHPCLFTFALMIPQTWTVVSFISFFLTCAVVLWESSNKGWIIKTGVSGAVFLIIIHLVGFAYVFRPDDPTLYDLTPLEPTLPYAPQRHETVFGVEVAREAQAAPK